MASGRRVVDLGASLSLALGIGVMALLLSVLGPSKGNVAVVAGTLVSFLVAAVLAVRYPALESRSVWVFSVTTFVVFLALDLLLGVGATVGEGMVVSILAIWIAALGVAYLLAFAGGYARAKQWRSVE